MYQNILIESLDHYGRGIAHLDNKVTFVKNALPNDVVDIKITKTYSKYNIGEVLKYHQKSKERIPSPCPFFDLCGGCQLLNLKYADTLNYKLNKVKELFLKNKINYNKDIEVIKNPQNFNYRHKLSLKIKDNKIGFYEEETHNLIAINACLIANQTINEVIQNYQSLNITNGELTIRVNQNQEILLIINSQDKLNINISELKKKVKLIGIVYNNKLVYGQDFYYERLFNHLFKISYDAFFQVNPYITIELFSLILSHIKENNKVLDLYCGVGTLSIIASLKAQKVYGMEIVPNAVLNALENAKLNNKNNIEFFLGDVSQKLSKLKLDVDTLIVDPPRAGLSKKTIDYILKNNFKNIIYVSCDINTLIRDLKLLENKYTLKEYKILDMFSCSYHLESFCFLESIN